MTEPSPAAPSTNTTNKKEKAKPANLKIPPKKPPLTKAERRALQEKQRAAKAAAQSGGGGGGGKQTPKQAQAASTSASDMSRQDSFMDDNNNNNRPDSTQDYENASNGGGGGDKALQMFAHLPQYRDRSNESHLSGVVLHSNDKSLKVKLHPAVFDLGIKYANGTIRGANARCRAMMETFKIVICDYVPPEQTSKSRRMDLPTLLDHQVIKPSFQHWTTQCRTHSITMGNAVNFLKIAIANLSRDTTLPEAQSILCEQMDAYVKERIDFADKVITKHGLSKIVNGDVLLVYGRSEVIQMLMLAAHSTNVKFRVIVADSRPLLEGQQMLKALVQAGIPCTYILLNSISYVMMREVTKVFMGAAALMSDGSILSRVGTGTVAMIAKSNNIPVLFCCESYKISNRVQLESFTGNELGNPDDVANIGYGQKSYWLDGWGQEKLLKLLNLIYDLTDRKSVV